MKNGLKILLFSAFAFLAVGTAKGQQIKLGYINSQELISVMPESDSAQVQLEAYAQELSDQIESLQVELNNKFQQYQKDLNTLTDLVRQSRETELNDLSRRFQEAQQMAQEDMQRMQYLVMNPILDKADEAIQRVSKANGITAVFDTAQGAMLYFDESQMTDLLPLVMADMGISR